MNEVDDVARALDLLARRADAVPVADRLVAVHRRARRAARVRTTVVVAALCVAVGGAGAVLGGTGSQRGSGPAVTPTTPGLEVSLEPETDPVVLAAVDNPRYEGTGIRFVVLRLRITGTTPGGVYGLKIEQPGIGYQGNGDVRCTDGAPLLPVNLDELETVQYPAESPAQARIVVTVTGCDPVGAVTKEVTVTVPPAPAPTG